MMPSSNYGMPHPAVIKYYERYKKKPEAKNAVTYINSVRFELDAKYELKEICENFI